MTSSSESNFKQNDQTHLQHLKLKGLRPKTIEAYSRVIFWVWNQCAIVTTQEAADLC